ncbi:MAG: asparagine--tRNA ligase [Acidobacteria bacterium]|nr:asparagine--tRNA ligase [Acidobacteriota bacterium]
MSAVLKSSKPGDTVSVGGWIKSLRSSKNVAFMHLNDGSVFDSVQVVLEESLDNYDRVLSLLTGASVFVEGQVRESPAKGQRIEIVPSRVEIVGECAAASPVQKAGTSFEFLRTVAHMRPRTNTFGAVFRMRSALSFAVHSFFNQRGFVYVHSPILTTSDCEGAGEMFQVTSLDLNKLPRGQNGGIDYTKDFFGERCSLTVSGQLEAEILAMSLSKVYTFGPTFRAENSNTARHASEFWMIEPEFAFSDLEDDIVLAGDFVKYLIQYVFDHCGRDLRFFDERIEKGLKDKLKAVLEADFAVLDYTEAVKALKASGRTFEYPVEWGEGLQTEHERWITEEYTKRPSFVINYPRSIKPFYMYCNDDDRTVACFDFLVPRVGELIGGSQREHRQDKLMRRMQECDMDPAKYGWYMDLRRFGSVPHGGFGLGFERALMFVTGMANIRDVCLCPRVPGNAAF